MPEFVCGVGRSARPESETLSGIAGWRAVSVTRKKPDRPSAGITALVWVETRTLTQAGSDRLALAWRANGPMPPHQTSATLVPLVEVMEVKEMGFGAGTSFNIVPVLPAGPTTREAKT